MQRAQANPPCPAPPPAIVVLPPVTKELWRHITTARGRDGPQRREALDAIARRYQTPIRRTLLALGVRYQDVPDLTNEFLGVCLPQRVLPAADPSQGSFNGLVLRALRNFLIDYRRRTSRRAGLHELYLGDLYARRMSRANRHDPRAQDPSLHIADALRAAQEHFIASGRRAHWRAFALYILVPLCVGAARPTLTQIAAALAPSHGSLTPDQIASMIRVVRDRVRKELTPPSPPPPSSLPLSNAQSTPPPPHPPTHMPATSPSRGPPDRTNSG